MTSKLQPMDQGIIKNIKHHYRRSKMQRNLRRIDSGLEIDNINLLESIELLHKSWGAVTQFTIANCFHRAGFTKDINKNSRTYGGRTSRRRKSNRVGSIPAAFF
ncbi:major centromere autoantigen B-like [Sipha flava]|uniref:Major centromere autoantigen B-like n=1 Tax=Sipha flava TaxID=143950 RepID=A0A8B8F2K9_9HEMI|nr:major centromere autoantigen B-like [Sipha flava]